MRIDGDGGAQDELVSCSARRCYQDGQTAAVEDVVQSESVLQVYANDCLLAQIICSASHIDELVVGRLYTEGLIGSIEGIEWIRIAEGGRRVDLRLDGFDARTAASFDQVVPTYGGRSAALAQELADNGGLAPVRPIEWTPSWIFRMTREFEEDKTAHARTWGVHSAYLAMPDRTLVVREDLGRHNAFDKAVGWALLNDVDLAQCLLFTSGRVPTDMVMKAIRARIPLLVSKAVATAKTVELARRFGLTLICSARSDFFDVMAP